MKKVLISVFGRRWTVPYGFGKLYRELATQYLEFDRVGEPARLHETLRDILGLAGYEASTEAIARWDLRKRVDAHVYCGNVHARASDNPIRKCPRPQWMPEPWQGRERGEGIWAGPGPTPIQ